MSPINKFEAVGIFTSVVIMAAALILVRFNADTQFFATAEDSEQSAIVVVSGNESNSELAEALVDSITSTGVLDKLIIDDVVLGSGEGVKLGDTVAVDYIGSTQDGIQFDSSYVRGEPFSFTAGEHRVIEGWEEGILGMKVGGQRILVIPAKMGYGDLQVGTIPAGSVLVFAVELLEIN